MPDIMEARRIRASITSDGSGSRLDPIALHSGKSARC